jgi:hypothetical protein
MDAKFWIIFILLAAFLSWLWRWMRDRSEFVNPRTPDEHARLSELIRRGDLLVQYVEANRYPSPDVARRIVQHWRVLRDNKRIGLTPESTDTPGFVVNKTTALQLCLTKDPAENDIDDLNMASFVLVHEISHLGAIEYEHGSEFMRVFRALLRAAVELKIWKYVNYKKTPQKYCNYLVNSTPIVNPLSPHFTNVQ